MTILRRLARSPYPWPWENCPDVFRLRWGWALVVGPFRVYVCWYVVEWLPRVGVTRRNLWPS